MSVLNGIFVIIFMATVVWSRQLRFDDFKVFSIKVENEEQLRVLKNLENDDDGYSYWKDPILGKIADLVVPPNKLNEFNALVSASNLNTTLKISNIQRLMLHGHYYAKILSVTYYHLG